MRRANLSRINGLYQDLAEVASFFLEFLSWAGASFELWQECVVLWLAEQGS